MDRARPQAKTKRAAFPRQPDKLSMYLIMSLCIKPARDRLEGIFDFFRVGNVVRKRLRGFLGMESKDTYDFVVLSMQHQVDDIVSFFSDEVGLDSSPKEYVFQSDWRVRIKNEIVRNGRVVVYMPYFNPGSRLSAGAMQPEDFSLYLVFDPSKFRTWDSWGLLPQHVTLPISSGGGLLDLRPIVERAQEIGTDWLMDWRLKRAAKVNQR